MSSNESENTTTTKQTTTTLFKQKETGGSIVYGNAVIRAFYAPKTLIAELGQPTPEMITVTITRKEEN